MPLKIAVLASHTGTNLRALHAAQRPDAFTVDLVVSNNGSSGALEYAREHGIPHAHLSGRTHPDADALDQAMLAALRRHDIDLIVTAGYMKKVGPAALAAYDGRVLNVHPALLPRHGGQGMYGLNVHRAVLEAGDTVSGASVHLVTAEYDEGPVIARQEVPVLPADTPESLAERVLAAEHILLPAVVHDVATRGVFLSDFRDS
ncbi:phosphoribosylglycinamide formyltransferase [Streptosporangium carneum]|uniref:Phosphoribosylglycinamide formyltransferase n=1 Tax=Streptosporangium carneum TaxID=47481 RepID=A0A9W6I5S2_9ACTN|nr:phosphoribosylglycinamide formyltransferase [Streptosporangium carneum]GLK11465.1 phosphoribosylglycinamide formyltransferase [Streptosporangium carneum]